jgi:hypothetical protein
MLKYINEGAYLKLLNFNPISERKGFKGSNIKEVEFKGVIKYK